MTDLPKPVEWRDVVGYEGIYKVSSNGEVLSVATGRIRATSTIMHGYKQIGLYKNGELKQFKVHHLVLIAFVGPRNGKETNHINGIKDDNRLVNLEWSTRSQNVKHSYYQLGHLVKPVIGTCIDTGLEKQYQSLAYVAADGFEPKIVGQCAANKAGYSSHNGWTWRFVGAPKKKREKRFSETQMREYRNQALEEAAKKCEEQRRDMGTARYPFWNNCAAAIRALKGEVKCLP